jgi:hypothetical protein
LHLVNELAEEEIAVLLLEPERAVVMVVALGYETIPGPGSAEEEQGGQSEDLNPVAGVLEFYHAEQSMNESSLISSLAIVGTAPMVIARLRTWLSIA